MNHLPFSTTVVSINGMCCRLQSLSFDHGTNDITVHMPLVIESVDSPNVVAYALRAMRSDTGLLSNSYMQTAPAAPLYDQLTVEWVGYRYAAGEAIHCSMGFNAAQSDEPAPTVQSDGPDFLKPARVLVYSDAYVDIRQNNESVDMKNITGVEAKFRRDGTVTVTVCMLPSIPPTSLPVWAFPCGPVSISLGHSLVRTKLGGGATENVRWGFQLDGLTPIAPPTEKCVVGDFDRIYIQLGNTPV